MQLTSLQTFPHIPNAEEENAAQGLGLIGFFVFALLSHHSAAVQMCHCHGMPDAFCEKSMHNTFIVSAHNF
jgi:hypothetical protein